jgi:small-conductance mechanosensitive channel
VNWFVAFDVALDNLSAGERAAASFGTLVLLGAVFLVARRESAQRDSRLWSVVAGLVSMSGLIAASAALAVIWNVEASAWAALSSMQLQAELLVRVFITMTFFAVVYVGTGVLHRTVAQFMKQRDGITEHQAEVTYRILQISVYVIALLAVLGFWQVNLSGLLIGAGFAGIVVGMAARQTLGAVIAGLVLMFARPFEIGDWVKVGDKDGIVTDITIVNTRLQTFDGEYVMLPNDYVGSNEVVNRSRKGRLRIHVEVGVDYGTDVDRARKTAKGAMADVEDILTVPRPQVVLKEFGDSSVVLDLRFWIDKPSARRMWRAQTSVISAVKTAFEEAGITIPFPQRSLSPRDNAGGFRVQQPPAGADAAAGGGEAVRTDPARDADEGQGQRVEHPQETNEGQPSERDGERGDRRDGDDHPNHDPPAADDDLEPAVEPADGTADGQETDTAGEDDDESPASAVERAENEDD